MSSAFNEHLAVIDLETIGRWSNACILSLGLTVAKYTDKDITFERLVSEGLYLKFDLREQIANGRTKDNKTIEWWKKQKAESRAVLNPSPQDISIYTLDKHIEKFFRDRNINMKKVDFYDRKCFDINKIQYVYEEELGYETVPWNYISEFELATAMRFLGFDRYGGIKAETYPGVIYHHALHDAALDHLRLMNCLHTTLDE